jgi:hypothetical protein
MSFHVTFLMFIILNPFLKEGCNKFIVVILIVLSFTFPFVEPKMFINLHPFANYSSWYSTWQDFISILCDYYDFGKFLIY